MEELSKNDLANICMLVDAQLRRPGVIDDVDAGTHLDEDALNSFVEGSLSEPEAEPMIRHLVECGLCRRVTGQLVRLSIEMGESETREMVLPPQPANIRQFLADLAARIGLSSEDDTVFAYHAPAEDFRPKDASAASPDPDDDTQAN